ncbi:MAG: integrase family protein [Tardiphaga sp.]|jgi:integrase|nr:integrase family protein [Tardiphaga sp.]
MTIGEFIVCKVMGIRDPVAHRRYWKLMTVCAANCERITVNAAKGIQFDASPKNTRDVSEAEFQAVYALATERMQIAMDLASNIGQRRGDLLTIRIKDCTDEGILIHQGKTKAVVLVAWSPELRKTEKRALALKPDVPREFLLRTETGAGYTKSGFGANWQRLMKKALTPGVTSKRFKFHDLRAKAATEKAEQGTDKDAQDLLGHANARTTGGYIRRRKPTRATPIR